MANGEEGKGKGVGPKKEDLSAASQMVALMNQMMNYSNRISSSFESQAEASAQMAENMKNMSTGELVNQLVQVNATLKEVLVALQNLNTTSKATFDAISEGALIAVSSTSELSDATAEAAKKAEESKSSYEQLRDKLTKTGKDALNAKRKLQAIGDYLQDEFPIAAGAALGALSGLRQSFKNVVALGKGFFGFAKTIAKSLFSIGTSILSIPFKLFNGLIGLAQQGGGGVSEWAQALNDLRKEFGSLQEPLNKTIISGAKNMNGFADSGLNAMRVFGNAAERVQRFKELFVAGGAALQGFTEEFDKNGGAILGFQKGLGATDEQMGALARQAQATGTSLTKNLIDITKQSQHLGKQFGVSAKLISKDMFKATADVRNFGSMSAKQVGVAVTYFRKLGVELDKVTGVMDAFQTFDEAADKVSTLNQVFGTSIDAMKMVNAENPAERIEQLRKEFARAGIDGEKMTMAQRSLVKSLTNLDDAEQKLIFSSKNRGVSLDKLRKEGDKAEKKEMSQAEAMSKLADSMDRVLKSGSAMQGGFFDQFVKGFTDGIMRTKEMQELMINIRRSLMEVYHAGVRLGKAFVEYFPGVKDFLGGLAELFRPEKFRKLANGVTDVFIQFFKDLETGKASFPELMERLKEKFFDFFNSEKGAGQRVMGGFSKIMMAIRVIIAGGVSWVLSTITDMVKGIVNFIKNPTEVPGAGKIGDAAQEYINPIATAFRDGWKELSPALSEMFSLLFDKLVNFLRDKVKAFVKDHWAPMLLYFAGPIVGRTLLGAGTAALGKGIASMVSSAFTGPVVNQALSTSTTVLTNNMGQVIGTATTTTATTAAPAAAGMWTKIGLSMNKAAGSVGQFMSSNVGKFLGKAAIVAAVATAAVDVGAAIRKYGDDLEKKGFDPATAKIAAGTTGLINTLTFGLIPEKAQGIIAESIAKIGTTLEKKLDEWFGPGLADNLKMRAAAVFQVFGGIGDLISGLWNGDSKKIDQAIKDIGTGILDLLVSTFIWLYAELPKLILQLGVYLVQGFFKLVGWLNNKLGDIFKALENIPIFGPLFGLIGDFFHKIGNLWNSVAGLFGKFQELLKSINVTQWFKDAWGWMTKFFSSGESSGEGFFSKLFGWFRSIVKVVEEPYRLIRKLFNIIFSWDTKKSFMENMKDKWDATVKAFTSSIETVKEAFKQILQGPKDAWNWLKENFTFQNFKKLGGQMLDGLLDGLKALKEKIVEKFTTPINDIKIFLGIASPSKLMSQMGDDMVTGILKTLGEFPESALKFFTDFKDGLIALFSGETFFNIFKGIVEGIKNALGEIADFGPFKAVIDIARKIFKIGSPSKVFMKIGDQIVEGMFISMDEIPKKTGDVMTDAVSAAQDEITNMPQVAPQAQVPPKVPNLPAGEVSNMLQQMSNLADVADKAKGVDKKIQEFNQNANSIASALNGVPAAMAPIVSALSRLGALLQGQNAKIVESTKQFVDLLDYIQKIGDIGEKSFKEDLAVKIWKLNIVAGTPGHGLNYHLSLVPEYYEPIVASANIIANLIPGDAGTKVLGSVRNFIELLESIDKLGDVGVKAFSEDLGVKIWKLNTAAGDRYHGLGYHLSMVPESYGPITDALKSITTFLKTSLSTTEVIGALNNLTALASKVTMTIDSALTPTLKAMNDMVNAVTQIDAALSKAHNINLKTTLDKFKANFGSALGSSGKHVVSAKDVTINVNFTVAIDATKLEGAILEASNSKIKGRINTLIGAIKQMPDAEVGLKDAAPGTAFKQIKNGVDNGKGL
jgi:hypothetical protein